MSPAYRLLFFLILAGSFFTRRHLVTDEKSPRHLESSDASGEQIRILQQQVQMLQEQVIALEEENLNLFKQSSSPQKSPAEDSRETQESSAQEDLLRRALRYLQQPEEPIPLIIPTEIQAMRTAVREALVGEDPETWETREAVWKTIGLIPDDCDLLLCFEDMILENFPLLPMQDGSRLQLEGSSLHLSQIVPAFSALLTAEKGTLWGDEERGKDDARWLHKLASDLGDGLQAQTEALLAAPLNVKAGVGSTMEALFFRAPAAIRDLFRSLPPIGVAMLQKNPEAEGGTTSPSRVSFPPISNTLGRQASWDGTWGGTLTALLLKQFLPEATATAAIKGLVSDRMIGFFDDPNDPNDLQLAWSSRWNSVPEARIFHSTLKLYFTNRCGDPDTSKNSPDRCLFSTNNGRKVDIRFASDPTHVIVTLASNPGWLEALIAAGSATRP